MCFPYVPIILCCLNKKNQGLQKMKNPDQEVVFLCKKHLFLLYVDVIFSY